jgi:16S rRNA (guanine527-N7)-methyltransferase
MISDFRHPVLSPMAMQLSRIADLLRPFIPESSNHRLAERELQNISMYIDILQRWNARINLTAIRDEKEIVTRHFGESLFAAAHLFPTPQSKAPSKAPAPTAADVGSGAGFPGIPIKLWAPQIALTLIESNQKKTTFLREVVRRLTLTNVNIQNARAEDVPAKFDLVTLRAVEQFKKILPVSANLLAPSGRLALLISNSQVEQAHSILLLNWEPPIPVPQSGARVLLVGKLNS